LPARVVVRRVDVGGHRSGGAARHRAAAGAASGAGGERGAGMSPSARAPFRIVDVINLSSSADALLRDRVLAIRPTGDDNRIVCGDGARVAGLRGAGIRVHTVRVPRGLEPLALATALLELTAYFVRERPDLVHTHCSVPGVIGRLAARLAG